LVQVGGRVRLRAGRCLRRQPGTTRTP
jgi:hypothetical protein